MRRNLLTRIFIMALLSFSLIQSSYADYDSFTVNIPRSNGTYEAIVLKQSGSGYTGPRGEYYSSFPSVSQLQAVYGSSVGQDQRGQNQQTIGQTVNVPVQAPTQQQIQNVNIPSPNGTYRAIEIRKTDNGYLGPLGELYSNFPTVEELQINYGAISDEQIQQSSQDMALKSRLLSEMTQRTMAAQTQKQLLQKQEIDKQIQKSDQEMADRQKQWQVDAEKERQKSLFDAAHPFGIPTTAEKKKSGRDYFIMGCFMWSLLLLSLGALVWILLLHIPNRFIHPTKWEDVPLVIAVRKGMTQANFNASNSKILAGELLVVSILLGVGFKSFLVFGIAFLGFTILLCIKTTAFIIIYLFSSFWMLVAAQLGYLLCGGQLANVGNYLSAWMGGVIFAILGFMIALGLHMSGIQYVQDL